MNYGTISQQIPVFAAILTSTILILRFLSDNRKYSMERQKEIKDEVIAQARRDASVEIQGRDLIKLSLEFHEFRNEVRKELNDLKDIVLKLQNLIKGVKE